ncbi:hypothetical protein ACFLT1_07840 [Bacteroidota bacterium]
MQELFSYGPGSVKEFLKANLTAILYTIIFHLIVLIILVVTKVHGLKNDKELGVLLDFTKELSLKEQLEAENIEVPAEWIERVYEAREKASNRAVNVNDQVNQEISTENYVQELLDELESQKDEEFRQNREKLKEIISSSVYEDELLVQQKENSDESYTGPTTITYEFLEEPKGRKKRQFFIPVYKCEGSGRVIVEVVVKKDGTVPNVSVISAETQLTPECFIEAAEKAARNSLFQIDYSAPERQKARITYEFIAQ